ncbi:hypothetical protein PAT3040_02235 [Paenibacillus agaridevorans]|uniref:Uncharacterized protein n=1 Tax=Paenibacillus agaridevorans TaxID=171404 RepID=A0A2R5EPT4_9BACL|nr:hypothetical protein [Paenibacillus agaridevorans]GBG07679.1 hypothetical protein PAT3040_02235 [Paenibacillus agaridevorans]
MAYTKMKQLVKQFCNTLIDHQVTDLLPSWKGGFACPACKSIHGRSGDAIFPLYFMAVETGELRYKQAARLLVSYMQRRQLFDGSWLNDEPSDWKGTTVFQVLSLSHAYDYLLKAGEQKEAEPLLPMIENAAEYLVWAFCKGGIPKNNINYLISSAAALQWCSQILQRADYAEEAGKLMETSLPRINRDGFIVGESKFPHAAGDQIDIGYNIDMTIGAIAEYAMLTDDQSVRAEAVRALRAHMEMMYPDGSLDNSFGSRSYKWTMYGSKTAHGCQMAYMMLADMDPAFAVAAERNMDYLISCITKQGMVGYGPAHEQIFDESCIHSTFNRADSLAIALVYGKWGALTNQTAQLPSNNIFNFKYYPSLNSAHIRSQSWMGTISGYGSINAPTGGMMSYLWNEQLGAVQAGSATVYKRIEIVNMPQYPGLFQGPTTPRIEAAINGEVVSSLYEHQPALLFHEQMKDQRNVRVTGKLKSVPLAIVQVESQLFYTIDYEWSNKEIIKKYYIDVQTPVAELSITEPVIISDHAEVKETESGMQLTKQAAALIVSGTGEQFSKQTGSGELISSVFPAIQCLPLCWKMTNVNKGVYSFTITFTME